MKDNNNNSKQVLLSVLGVAMFIWRFSTYFFGMILGIFGWIFKPKKIKSSESN